MNFEQALTHFIPQIEAEMRRVMAPPAGQADLFYGMLHYHLGWVDPTLQPVQSDAGKRLRPLFTLLCCRAAGGNPERALPAAASVELVHNFSLIHDDIEDNSATRRGRATVWALWGEPQAVNAGDALFSIARHALLDLQAHNVSPSAILQAITRLDQTCLTLCRGQYLDMSFEQTLDVDLAAYMEMIQSKTAALLACSGFLGGLVATEDLTAADSFWQLGLALGLAFQMQDDLLGIWGLERVTGKPAGDDLRRRKKTLPVVFALTQAERALSARFRSLYTAPQTDEATLAEMISLLESSGAKAYTEEKAAFYIEQAQAALAAIEAKAENKLALQEMAQFLIERAH